LIQAGLSRDAYPEAILYLVDKYTKGLLHKNMSFMKLFAFVMF
jgi:hypothetical protein